MRSWSGAAVPGDTGSRLTALSGRPWHTPGTNSITSLPCSAAGHHKFSTQSICSGLLSPHFISLISPIFITPYKIKKIEMKSNRSLRRSNLQFQCNALDLPWVSSSCWHYLSHWFEWKCWGTGLTGCYWTHGTAGNIKKRRMKENN